MDLQPSRSKWAENPTELCTQSPVLPVHTLQGGSVMVFLEAVSFYKQLSLAEHQRAGAG